MNREERIYIAPKVHGQRSVQSKLRLLSLWLLFGALCWGGIYLIARHGHG